MIIILSCVCVILVVWNVILAAKISRMGKSITFLFEDAEDKSASVLSLARSMRMLGDTVLILKEWALKQS